MDTPALQHVFQHPPGRDRSAQPTEVDHVENRSIPDTTPTSGSPCCSGHLETGRPSRHRRLTRQGSSRTGATDPLLRRPCLASGSASSSGPRQQIRQPPGRVLVADVSGVAVQQPVPGAVGEPGSAGWVVDTAEGGARDPQGTPPDQVSGNQRKLRRPLVLNSYLTPPSRTVGPWCWSAVIWKSLTISAPLVFGHVGSAITRPAS
jgi:hypothetical protein